MKVFAYMPTPGGLTGAPRRLLTLASILRDEGIEMCIATQRDSELFKVAKELGLETAEVEPVGVLRERHGALFGGNAVFRMKALFSLLVQNLSVARKIWTYGADAVWIRGSKGVAFAAPGALLSGRPLIWDVDYEWPSRGAVRWLHRLGLWVAKRVVFQYSAAPDAIFGNKLAAHYRRKFRTIVPGIDLAAMKAFRVKFKERGPRKGRPFVILQVGTICERKNQKLVVDAITRITKEIDDTIQLQFAGSPYEYEYAEALRWKEESSRYIEVKLLGWRDDIHALMVQADLLVMPSKDEGVPNAVQEAMTIGLPVLVSDTGGMPEIVSHGETGWVLPPHDTEKWGREIENCRRHPELCFKVGEAGAGYAEKNFGTEAWGRQYAQVIRESIRGRYRLIGMKG